MISYTIQIANGDANTISRYYFVHKDWKNISKEESDAAFDSAVKELNHIYSEYGRFATQTAILNLFHKFEFELSVK